MENNRLNHKILKTSSKSHHDSILNYDITEEDILEVKLICRVSSDAGQILSKECVVKIIPTDEPKEYKAANKWALLIANGNYQQNFLATPINDAQQIAKKLEKIGFRSIVLANLNLTEMKNAVTMFASFIDKGDYVVFYYGGHGFNYHEDLIIPIDSLDDDNIKLNNTVSSVWIKNSFQKHHPALIFTILDMCRTISTPEINHSMANETKVPMAARNSVTLYATSQGYASLEDPSNTSILCKHLLPLLDEKSDLQTMVRRVMEGIQYEDAEIYQAQIPTLHIDMPESRSLTDPHSYSGSKTIDKWQLLTSTGGTHKENRVIGQNNISVSISLKFGGDHNAVSNIIDLAVKITVEGPEKLTTKCLLNTKNASIKTFDAEQVYEIYDTQSIKNAIVVQVLVRDSSEQVVEKIVVNMGLPSIMKAKLWMNCL